MGAHTLGGARYDYTGYNGSWTPTREAKFDNEYYTLMLEKAFIFENRVCLEYNFNVLKP